MCSQRKYYYTYCQHGYTFTWYFCEQATPEQKESGTGCNLAQPIEAKVRSCCSVACCNKDLTEKYDAYHAWEDQWQIPRWKSFEQQEGLRSRGSNEEIEGKKEYFRKKDPLVKYCMKHSEKCLPQLEQGFGITNERRLAQGMTLYRPRGLDLPMPSSFSPRTESVKKESNQFEKSLVFRYDEALYMHAQLLECRQRAKADAPKPKGAMFYDYTLRESRESTVLRLESDARTAPDTAERLRSRLRKQENRATVETLPENYEAALHFERLRYPWLMDGPIPQPSGDVTLLADSATHNGAIEGTLVGTLRQWANSDDVTSLLHPAMTQLKTFLAAHQLLGAHRKYYALDWVESRSFMIRLWGLILDFELLIIRMSHHGLSTDQKYRLKAAEDLIESNKRVVRNKIQMLWNWWAANEGYNNDGIIYEIWDDEDLLRRAREKQAEELAQPQFGGPNSVVPRPSIMDRDSDIHRSVLGKTPPPGYRNRGIRIPGEPVGTAPPDQSVPPPDHQSAADNRPSSRGPLDSHGRPTTTRTTTAQGGRLQPQQPGDITEESGYESERHRHDTQRRQTEMNRRRGREPNSQPVSQPSSRPQTPSDQPPASKYSRHNGDKGKAPDR